MFHVKHSKSCLWGEAYFPENKERIQNKLRIVRSDLGWIYSIREFKTAGIAVLFRGF